MKLACNRFAKFRERENQPKKKQSRITDFFKGVDENTHTIDLLQDQQHTRIECFQINNQKRIMSCENINNITSNLNSFIVFGQEPSSYDTQVTGLNRRHNIVQELTHRPRAYIFTHKNIRTWQVPDLCSRDVAACLTESSENGSRMLLVSVYWTGG